VIFVNLISFITSNHKYLEGRKVVIMLDDNNIFIDPYWKLFRICILNHDLSIVTCENWMFFVLPSTLTHIWFNLNHIEYKIKSSLNLLFEIDTVPRVSWYNQYTNFKNVFNRWRLNSCYRINESENELMENVFDHQICYDIVKIQGMNENILICQPHVSLILFNSAQCQSWCMLSTTQDTDCVYMKVCQVFLTEY
jgi:hypothetical protein